MYIIRIVWIVETFCWFVFLDGSLLYEKIPNALETDKTALNNLSPGMKKRNFDEANG